MARPPYQFSVKVRYDPEGRWAHDWEQQQFTHISTITFLLDRNGPGPRAYPIPIRVPMRLTFPFPPGVQFMRPHVPPSVHVEPVGYHGLEAFRKNNPSQFKGGFDPNGAQLWIEELEKIFAVMECPEASKQIEAEGREINWECFKRRFLEKYFLEDLRRKEVEFLNLKQGSMIIEEYAAKFDDLSKFCPYFNNNGDDRSRCTKFESGLRLDIKLAIGYQEIIHFPTLVNRCRIYEDDAKAKQAQWKSSGPQRNHPNRRGDAQRRGKPYQVSQRYQGSSSGDERFQNFTRSSNRVGDSGTRCFICGGPHFARECSQKNYVCFRCGKPSHFICDCPEMKRENNNQNNQAGGSKNKNNHQVGRPRTQGRVFTMSGEETSQSDTMI
ncbi:uncharacterized protein LOC113866555 [Abrus precatorius]|uniref:Uncharacterized protein LOC113866555 n=1 Tax=Abrus precatorius TaxID=3816 RepID=A0A8B8LP46_ABRPR|nr:uncharacterized protein LOC113866555 [Abrus precatorius]